MSEMTDHPVAPQMLDYLLVRVHALAYAKALEKLTKATVSKMLNRPMRTPARRPPHSQPGAPRGRY